MGKQRDKHPFEDNAFIEDLFEWMESSEGQRSIEVRDAVWPLLEEADVDAKNRKIIWQDGQRLSITESVRRIQADYPDFPIELIETHVIGWLELEFAPPTYSEKQLEELDQLTEEWIDDHERRTQAR